MKVLRPPPLLGEGRDKISGGFRTAGLSREKLMDFVCWTISVKSVWRRFFFSGGILLRGKE